ncbi:unnamed protein product, partial [Prunus brigantina]
LIPFIIQIRCDGIKKRKKKSFQDLQNSGGRGKKASASPSQAVAAGIFQINTAVSTFRQLVDAIGTAKDTPDHHQKLMNSSSTRDQHRQ